MDNADQLLSRETQKQQLRADVAHMLSLHERRIRGMPHWILGSTRGIWLALRLNWENHRLSRQTTVLEVLI